MEKEKIIEDVLEKYKKQGKVTFLLNDSSYHADNFEDLDLEELCYDIANNISKETRKELIEDEIKFLQSLPTQSGKASIYQRTRIKDRIKQLKQLGDK